MQNISQHEEHVLNLIGPAGLAIARRTAEEG